MLQNDKTVLTEGLVYLNTHFAGSKKAYGLTETMIKSANNLNKKVKPNSVS